MALEQGEPPDVPTSPQSTKETCKSLERLCCDACGPLKSGPCIEPVNITLQYSANTDTNLQDRDAYAVVSAKFNEEASILCKLNEMLEKADEFAVMLYTWRSCAKAIADVQSKDASKMKEINEEKLAILQPLVEKLFALMQFQKSAIDVFCHEVKRLSSGEVVADTLLLSVGRVLHVFSTIDELKIVKSSIHNDYTALKRTQQSLSRSIDHRSFHEEQDLTVFLATRNVIRETLKSKLAAIEGKDEFLCKLVNLCVELFETKRYILPSERHMLVNVMAFSLYLLDQNDQPTNLKKLDSTKKISIARLDKIFKEMETIPLYGDMVIVPFKTVEMCPSYDASKWPLCNSKSKMSKQDFSAQVWGFKQEHNTYLCEIMQLLLLCKNEKKGESDKDIHNMVITGLQLLSKWTSTITELFSWKCLHLTHHTINPSCPEDAHIYEKAILYNYSDEEKHGLVETVALIKGLQALLKRHLSVLTSAIKRHIYGELQSFIQIHLREPLRKSIKHSSHLLTRSLKCIMHTCSDAQETRDDPVLQGKKSDVTITVLNKSVPPSSTQIHLARSMIESLLSSSGKKTLRKDINEKSIRLIETFHKESFFWPHMLQLDDTLIGCCELSEFWYREYFLDLTNAVQFPIKMSMPWILTSYALESQDASLLEYLFYPFDLYNDSAHFALRRFKSQFLYKEVEAEVTLCFEQLVYQLSQNIFKHYKEQAISLMMRKPFFMSPSARFTSLLSLKRLQLLGRTINLNAVISERVTNLLRKSLDAAICNFESSDITGVIELQELLRMNMTTHQILSRHLSLPTFDAILADVTDSSPMPHGRITLHVLWELVNDVLPNYCYNMSTNRFVKAGLIMSSSETDRVEISKADLQNLWSTEKAPRTEFSLNKIFETFYAQYSGFIGSAHLRSICELLGYEGISIVIKELINLIKKLIQGPLLKSVQTLLTAMPKKCKLPRYEYTSVGEYQFYRIQLKDIIEYSDLRTKIFGTFQELGNAILFCLLLEQTLSQIETDSIKQYCPFHSIIPAPYISADITGDERQAERKKIMDEKRQQYASLNVMEVFGSKGSTEELEHIREIDLLSRKKMCGGLEIFPCILEKIGSFLSDPVWRGSAPAKTGVMDVEGCSEFHRLWSAIQFSYCLPVGKHEFSVEQLFGDGLHWAGCTIINLLDQRNRFEILDFCYHLLKVNQVDMKNEVVAGVSIPLMMKRIRTYQLVNGQIFSILNRYLHRSSDDSKDFQEFQPLLEDDKDLEKVEINVEE